MFKKLGIVTGILGAAVLAFAAFVPSTASASTPPGTATASPAAKIDLDRWPAYIQGQPQGLHAGGAEGWYFWHDASGLHIATTTPANSDHVFTAVLASRGVFRDVDRFRLEGADEVRVIDGGHVLVARFHTYAGIDGVSFRLDGGDGIRLRFGEAGHLIDTSDIFIGHNGVHPAGNPFTVRRDGPGA